jgi:hypothetical protein
LGLHIVKARSFQDADHAMFGNRGECFADHALLAQFRGNQSGPLLICGVSLLASGL